MFFYPIDNDPKHCLASCLLQDTHLKLFAKVCVNHTDLLDKIPFKVIIDQLLPKKHKKHKKTVLETTFDDLLTFYTFLQQEKFNINHASTYTLAMLARRRRCDLLSLLHQHGADLDKGTIDGCTPAFFAAQEGQVDVLRALKALSADLDKSTNDGFTPAFIAAQYGHVDALRVLKELGADLDKGTNDGHTPACIAALQGHVDALCVLKELGANLDKGANDGSTPLFMAAQKGHGPVVEFLIQHKSQTQIVIIFTNKKLLDFALDLDNSIQERMRLKIESKKAQGATDECIHFLPIDIAEVMGHDAIVKLLNDVALAQAPAAAPCPAEAVIDTPVLSLVLGTDTSDLNTTTIDTVDLALSPRSVDKKMPNLRFFAKKNLPVTPETDMQCLKF